MKKSILILLFGILSFAGFSQSFTLDNIKNVWSPRYMPSVRDLDSTWSALWYRNTNAGGVDLNYVTTSSLTVSASTSLVSLTGLLTETLTAGETYQFNGVLSFTCDGTGGVKIDFNQGTATATYFIASVVINDFSNSSISGANSSALATAVGDANGFTTGNITFSGTLVVDAAGTFGLKFAQNAANNTSTILRGSYLSLKKID